MLLILLDNKVAVMNNIRFNYRTIQANPVTMKISADELRKGEIEYAAKLTRKYQDRLICPSVEVIVSNDGTKILRYVALADRILN